MNDKLYDKLLAAVMITGIAVSIALLIYTKHLYQNCSIISYIANGW